MAKISQYPSGAPPQNSDQFILARAGQNFKILWSAIVTALNLLYAPLSHSAASAAVHGLPANVNVLGDRTAAGEYIQHALVNPPLTAGDNTVFYSNVAVTYPVAYAAAPVVCGGGTPDAADVWTGVRSITNTGCIVSVITLNGAADISNVGWLAVGA